MQENELITYLNRLFTFNIQMVCRTTSGNALVLSPDSEKQQILFFYEKNFIDFITFSEHGFYFTSSGTDQTFAKKRF